MTHPQHTNSLIASGPAADTGTPRSALGNPPADQENGPGLPGWIARRISDVHEDEGGQLSILSLVVLLTLMLSLCAMVNVVHAVRGKLETQNAADGITEAAATQMARGMNAITAANHLIGEMHALTILYHALGGDDMEEGNSSDRTPATVRTAVTTFYQLARATTSTAPDFLRPRTETYDDGFDQDIVVEAAIGKSRLHLKNVGAYAYQVHAGAGGLYLLGEIVPYIGPLIKIYAGIIMGACRAFEEEGLAEWKVLDAMEEVASFSALKLAITTVRDKVLTVVNLYSNAARFTVPFRMGEVVDETAKYHDVDGSLFPNFKVPTYPLLELPVVAEQETFPKNEVWKSQLARAAVPWVHHWRLPMLQFGEDALWLSQFKAYYVEFTQSDIIEMTTRAKKNGIQLLILKDLDVLEGNKGEEKWSYSDGSKRAEELFAIVGFAQHERREIAAPRFFDSPHKDGFGAFAQAMIYNANQTTRGSGTETVQAQIGWDTLNFAETRVPEWKAGADPNKGKDVEVSYYRDRAPEPKVLLNWKPLLVPTTRIEDAARWQFGDVRKLLDRSLLDEPAARTH